MCWLTTANDLQHSSLLNIIKVLIKPFETNIRTCYKYILHLQTKIPWVRKSESGPGSVPLSVHGRGCAFRGYLLIFPGANNWTRDVIVTETENGWARELGQISDCNNHGPESPEPLYVTYILLWPRGFLMPGKSSPGFSAIWLLSYVNLCLCILFFYHNPLYWLWSTLTFEIYSST